MGIALFKAIGLKSKVFFVRFELFELKWMLFASSDCDFIDNILKGWLYFSTCYSIIYIMILTLKMGKYKNYIMALK